jgi:hypothetical protein
MAPAVSPGLVLAGEPQHHRLDITTHRRPAERPRRGRRPTAADDVAVPAQDRGRGDDQPDRGEAAGHTVDVPLRVYAKCIADAGSNNPRST